MGRFLESAKKAKKLIGEMADEAERFERATAGGGVALGSGGTTIINVNAAGASKATTIGSGGTGFGKSFAAFGDADAAFLSFLKSRGVTAKHQLENSLFIQILRAEFDKLRRDKGVDLSIRKAGFS